MKEADFGHLCDCYHHIEKLASLACEGEMEEVRRLLNGEHDGVDYGKTVRSWCGLDTSQFVSACSGIWKTFDKGLTDNPNRIRVNSEEDRFAGRLFYGVTATQFGECFIAFTDKGVCIIDFSGDERQILSFIKKKWPACELELAISGASEIRARIFNSSNQIEDLIDVHLIGTDFQIAVWKTIARIPLQGSVSYGEMAESIGVPKGGRAVGNAVGMNPLGYLIPCHRVLPKNGQLGGFAGGPAKKLAMLVYESTLNTK